MISIRGQISGVELDKTPVGKHSYKIVIQGQCDQDQFAEMWECFKRQDWVEANEMFEDGEWKIFVKFDRDKSGAV